MHSEKGLQAPWSGLTLLRALTVSWSLGQRKQSPNVQMKTKEFKLLVSGFQLHRITELPKGILKKIFMLRPTLVILIQRVWRGGGLGKNRHCDSNM